MAYSKTNWQDLPSTATPLNATNLNKIENELEVVDKSLKYMGNAPTDWNDAKTFGIYNVSGTYTNAPTSSQIWGVLIVYENRGSVWNPGTPSGSWIWQEFKDTSGKIYRRNAINTSNSWTSWRLDEPIETVSTTYETAIKYPNGTMICYGKKAFTVTFSTDNSRIDIDDPFTFPVSFVENPVLTMNTENDSDYSYAMIYGIIRNNTKVSKVNLYRFTSVTSGTLGLSYIAIGRWK